MALVDPLQKGPGVVAVVFGKSEHLVQTEFIKGYRVKRSGNPYIRNRGFMGIAVTVAVYGDIVHHVNINDPLSSSKIIMDSLRRSGH